MARSRKIVWASPATRWMTSAVVALGSNFEDSTSDGILAAFSLAPSAWVTSFTTFEGRPAPGALVIARSPELECVSAVRCQSTLLVGDGQRRTR